MFIHSYMSMWSTLILITRTTIAKDLMRDFRKTKLTLQLRVALRGFARPRLAVDRVIFLARGAGVQVLAVVGAVVVPGSEAVADDGSELIHELGLRQCAVIFGAHF